MVRASSSSQPNPTRSYDLDYLYSTHPSSQHDLPESSRRPQCQECGTRKMRLSSGQLICKRGHVQQNFRVEQGEDDGFLGDGVARKLRAKRVVRVKKLKSQFTSLFSFPDTDVEPDDDQAGASSSVFNSPAPSTYSRASSVAPHMDDDDNDSLDGADTDAAPPSTKRRRTIWHAGVGLQGTFEGRFSLLQCLQLVLRLQLHALRQKWQEKLPQHTEAIARDLWAMLISQLPVSEFPPEPLIAATFDWHTRSRSSPNESVNENPHLTSYDPEKEVNDHRRRMLFNRHRAQHGSIAAARMADPNDLVALQGELDQALQGMGTGFERVSTEDLADTQNDSDDLPDPEEELARLDPNFAEQRRKRLESVKTSAPSSDSDDGDIVDNTAQQTSRRPSSSAEPRTDDDEAPPNMASGDGKSPTRPVGWAQARHIKNDWYALRTFLKLPTTLSIIYMALWILKVPIMWTDLTTLVKSFELPYLNVVHKLPLSMTKFLNHYVLDDKIGLDTDIPPSVTALHQHTVSLANFLHTTYDISFGDGNMTGILARLVKDMALPPPFYVATKRVLSVLQGVNMKLATKEPAAMQSHTVRTKKASNQRTPAAKLSAEPNEFVLLAALLIVVKMRYGLDGRPRHERLVDPDRGLDIEPTRDTQAEQSQAGPQVAALSCAPDLEAWLAMLDARLERLKRSPTSVWDLDHGLEAMDMSDAQLHAYADFAERNLVLPNQLEIHAWRREENRRHWAKFADFIPTSPSDPPLHEPEIEQSDDIVALYQNHTSRPIAPAEDALLCGESYNHHQFRSDTTGLAFSPLYTRVLAHANRLVGIQITFSGPEAELAKAVRTAETGKTALETHFGIQAHLELVEQLLIADLETGGHAPNSAIVETDLGADEGLDSREGRRAALNALVNGGVYTTRASSAKSALRTKKTKKGTLKRPRAFKHRTPATSASSASRSAQRLDRQEREQRISQALEALATGEVPSIYSAAIRFSVPRRTLADRFHGKKSIDQHLDTLNSRPRTPSQQ